MSDRPLIGCATYRKTVDQTPPIEVFGLMPSYTQAVLEAGGLPALIPLGLSEADLEALLARLDGILLPGGGDVEPALYGADNDDPIVRGVDQLRDQCELLLIRHALETQKPLLAICRGLQVFNVALGGSLWADVYSQMPGAMRHDNYEDGRRDFLAHDVSVRPGSLLHNILGEDAIRVNSLHHQGIRRLAPQLSVSAVAPDNLIEAVEFAGHRFALAVQWHPENLLQAEPRMSLLFRHFVAAANGAGASGADGAR
ncbi:MAG TPA: gamma-glutamyl-gamma-aminobutyrate hydrolase family protein [Candidatus Binatia bacterium]|jgi:putative glutamine amidotransferase|nr:gamma-glutamyl-gamma-aminobutyrate hydrolase family protein [Candidatus Binatia bacterium]